MAPIKPIRHNGINYSSVLYSLLKQRWENNIRGVTDSILDITIDRLFQKINRQRACVLIQRNFRRFMVMRQNVREWNEWPDDEEYLNWYQEIEENERIAEEEQEIAEIEEYYVGGYDAYLADKEEERDALDQEASFYYKEYND